MYDLNYHSSIAKGNFILGYLYQWAGKYDLALKIFEE